MGKGVIIAPKAKKEIKKYPSPDFHAKKHEFIAAVGVCA